ncbi:MAG TPA: Xaa-Pro peptidase family protein [Gemmatimonadaceae bacterium]
MTNRRNFIGLSSLALVGVACRPGDSEATARATGGSSLPPALAALTSMKDQVKPITVDERRARLEKARVLMRQHKIDAVMLTGGTSLKYFTGLQWGLSERLLAAVIPVKGKPFMVTPKFEEERAMEQLRAGPLGADTALFTWEEDHNPYILLAKGLRDSGIGSGRLGIEETVRWVFSDGVAQAAPSLTLVSATPVTVGCRGVKDAHEVALMRLACAATLRAYKAAWQSTKEGMTQNEVRKMVSDAHEQMGFTGGASVQVGEYSALPHGSRTEQVIREGTIVMMDGGCSVDGYQSDITRTYVIGTPSDKMKQAFDIVRRAQDAALRSAKPGVQCQAVDAAARKVIVDAGYGPDYKYFSHRVGHGMGMDGHEWPYLVRGNTTVMEPGMTFSDEPGIYIPGEFGVRLEDDMHITAEGAELLTPQSGSLEQPFG